MSYIPPYRKAGRMHITRPSHNNTYDHARADPLPRPNRNRRDIFHNANVQEAHITEEAEYVLNHTRPAHSDSVVQLGAEIQNVMNRRYQDDDDDGDEFGIWTARVFNLPNEKCASRSDFDESGYPQDNRVYAMHEQVSDPQLAHPMQRTRFDVPVPSKKTWMSILLSRQSTAENSIQMLMRLVISHDCSAALCGLTEIYKQAPRFTRNCLWECSKPIQYRLTELLKNPQWKVVRAACQLSAYYYTIPNDSQCKEFQELVHTLLYKTADANKNMRYEANVALAAMAKYTDTFDSIRTLCAYGPTHRNTLIRVATVRLIVEVITDAEVSAFMNLAKHEESRKTVIACMVHFLSNASKEVRRYAMHLYNLLNCEGSFHFHAVRCLDRSSFDSLMMYLNILQQTQFAK